METPAAPTVSFPEPRLIAVRRVEFAPPKEAAPGPAAEQAASNSDELIAAQRDELTPDKLLVRIDVEAGRFIQTLTDARTMEMVWRYPSESQLAFSRAIQAYVRVVAAS